MTDRICAICRKPAIDDFDIGDIYWHVECYTEGAFEAHVAPLVTAKLEGQKQSDYERLKAFLAARETLSRDEALKLAVQNVLATEPNAIGDPIAFQKKVSATFKRITGGAA